jgi:peroxiredoxin family protein
MNASTHKEFLAAATSESALEELIDRKVEEKVEEVLRRREEAKTHSLAIIATKGTTDMGYPPFILASTAAALGWDVSVFFTFYGLELLKKDLDLRVSPIGNPAMPMKMPFGPKWLRNINWTIPNAVTTNIPGFEGVATAMMNRTLKNKGVASIKELRDICLESDVKLYACQMTVDLFNYERGDFIDEVADWIGATTYLPMSQQADVSLFV